MAGHSRMLWSPWGFACLCVNCHACWLRSYWVNVWRCCSDVDAWRVSVNLRLKVKVTRVGCRPPPPPPPPNILSWWTDAVSCFIRQTDPNKREVKHKQEVLPVPYAGQHRLSCIHVLSYIIYSFLFFYISSVESQKGTINVQICSIFFIYSLDILITLIYYCILILIIFSYSLHCICYSHDLNICNNNIVFIVLCI